MNVVGIHHIGNEEKVLSEKQTIRYVYHNFAHLPSTRNVITEAVPLGCHGFEWKVVLYPGGDPCSDVDTVFLSVYLRCASLKSDGEEVKATAEFQVTSADFSRKFASPILFCPKVLSYGWKNFIRREDVLDPTKGFLVDGNLTLDVTIQLYTDTSTVGHDKLIPTGMMKQESTLVMDMKNLLASAATTGDTKFTIGSEYFSAHLLILQARAPSLAALAQDYPTNTRIPIQGGTTPAAFQALLTYIYCDELPESEEFHKSAVELLTVADRFGCRGLKFAAETEIIATGINVDTAAEMILLGDAKNCARLKEAAMDFFVANSSSVMESDGWVNVTKSADLLAEILGAVVNKNKTRPAPDIISEDNLDYSKLRVSTLHELLKEIGLDIDGSKEILIGRLKEAKNKRNDGLLVENT